MGTAIIRVTTVISSVLMMAGIMELFSVVYFHAKRERCMFGMPLYRMYAIRHSSTPTVMTAARSVSANSSRERG